MSIQVVERKRPETPWNTWLLKCSEEMYAAQYRGDIALALIWEAQRDIAARKIADREFCKQLVVEVTP